MEHMDNDFPGITPQPAVADAEAATAFYRKAFEADELLRNRDQHGSVMHCELLVNGGRLLLYELPSGDADGRDRQKHPIPPTVTLHLYVADVDTTYHRALTAGATSLLPPTDEFWGDRYAQIVDPSGHRWSLATRYEDPSAEELTDRAVAWNASRQPRS